MQLRWRRAAKERAKRRSRKKRNKNLLIHFHLAYRTNSHPLECRRWIWGFSKPTTIDSKKKKPQKRENCTGLTAIVMMYHPKIVLHYSSMSRWAFHLPTGIESHRNHHHHHATVARCLRASAGLGFGYSHDAVAFTLISHHYRFILRAAALLPGQNHQKQRPPFGRWNDRL